MAQFGVHGIKVTNDEVVAVGRCYKGPLTTGAVFVLVQPESSGTFEPSQTVNLTVDKIVAYNREITEIDEGLTAELHMSGEGTTAVQVGSILST
jgi:hypothetical protein